MTCNKYTLTNTGSTIVTFNYQKCEDTQWQYQVELYPNQIKNIWLIEDTFQIADAFKTSVIIDTSGGSSTPSTPTPTPTPSITPTNTVTPTPTPTPTPTTSPIPGGSNLIIVNNSTTNQAISVFDDSGNWVLSNVIGSFPVGVGETLYAQHGTTSTNPKVEINWATSMNAQIRIGGFSGTLTNDYGAGGGGGTANLAIRAASPATPVDASEIIYVYITN